jgi:hypothetical protein
MSQALGAKDIDFESVEFSNAFVVESKDKKFAYDICHARMMDFLLQYPESTLKLERHAIAFINRGRYEPRQVEKIMGRVVTIRKLIPEYLYRD